jgi:NADPH2:quinone reductase
VELVRSLGATVAVDYAASVWPDAVREQLGGQEVTVALDGVGGDIGRQALELLGPGGRLLMFGYSSGRLTALSAGDLFANGLTVCAAPAPGLLRRPGGLRSYEERALAAAAAGTLRPVIGPPFPLAEAARAHATMEARATTGKTILVPEV